MKKSPVHAFLPTLFLMWALGMLPTAFAAKVGIFGCVHGDKEVLAKVLTQLRENGADYLIGNGDFVNCGNTNHLEEMLALLPKLSTLPREKTFLMPGNWEYETGMLPKDAIMMMERYGILITPDYDKSGIVEIEGKKIRVAHFPQHPVPGKFLPSAQFITTHFPRQAHLLLTMKRLEKVAAHTDLHVYGHTHIRASFYDKDTGKLVINAGGLDKQRKRADELISYVIYDTEREEVQFFAADSGEKLGPPVPTTKSLESIEESFDSGDYGICLLHHDGPDKIEKFLSRHSTRKY